MMRFAARTPAAALAGLLCTAAGCVPYSPPAPVVEISTARMRNAVAFLASPEMRGRGVGTPENTRAGEWLAAQFAEIGLEPGNSGSFFHEFAFGDKSGRNVVGIVTAPGVGGAGQAGEYVLLGAHYDGIGNRGNRLNLAADDNASGVAGMLEIARAVVAVRDTLRRNVVFVGFDAEEVGLIGSSAFVKDEVIPTENTRLALIFDLIGGHFFPWQGRRVIAMGTEHSTAMRGVLRRLREELATDVRFLGTYVLEPAGPMMARSDYRAFRQAEVPFVFFSSGTPWYYHLPQDSIEQIDFEQAADTARLALDTLLEVAAHACDVDFIHRPKPELEDLAQMRELLDEILAHREEIRLPAKTFAQMEKLSAALAASVARGKASRSLAHRALMLVFRAAQSSRPKGPR